MRLHLYFKGAYITKLWFAVRLYAITLENSTLRSPTWLWFAVRLYAITLVSLEEALAVELWFAVRLYAITLQNQHSIR